MIVIFSDPIDFSSDNVIDWLDFYKQKYIRINPEDTVGFIDNLLYDNRLIKINQNTKSKLPPSEEIKSIWYRRGELKNPFSSVKNWINKKGIEQKMAISKATEYQAVLNYYKIHLKKYPSLGSFESFSPNKLAVLEEASVAGLTIPKTLITTQKEILERFFMEANRKVIIKAIHENISGVDGNISYHNYTELVKKSNIESYPDNFFPTCFQEMISKKFEIRTFILGETTYSMAIFSQNDEQTKTDYRNYNYRRPNRNVPFQLPKSIEKKILLLMKKMNFDTGSVDFIYSEEKEFVFLEINPIGQYGMVSSPCNYYLDKKIANYLIHLDEDKE